MREGDEKCADLKGGPTVNESSMIFIQLSPIANYALSLLFSNNPSSGEKRERREYNLSCQK